MAQVEVRKGKTIELPVSLGFDVSDDVLSSQIRETTDPLSTLIASWDITFITDGSDGELLLTLDYEITDDITQESGFMFLKRTAGGDPVDIFKEPLEVTFIEEAP